MENEELFFKVKRLIKWADTKIDDIEIVKQIYEEYPSMEASEDPAIDISTTLGDVCVPK